MKQNKLRQSILAVLGVSAALAYSSQASAVSPTDLGAISSGANVSVDDTVPKRAWADYGTNSNYGWTHKADFFTFQVGSAADIAAGTRFDVSVDLKQRGSTGPLTYPGFSIWTSGTDAVVPGSANGSSYGHHWSQVRGPSDGGVAGNPCGAGGDCSLGSNGWLGASGGGNIVSGHNGWIGYANAGYSFTNGDGDKIQGLLAGSSNSSNIGQYSDGTALTNVNSVSPYVNGGFATLAVGDALLNLTGLKAGYYMIGLGGACPDDNLNGQSCGVNTNLTKNYTLTVSNSGVSTVPVPAAAWLFGSVLAGFGVVGRRKRAV